VLTPTFCVDENYRHSIKYRQCFAQVLGFAMVKIIFAGTVKKTGKNRGKNRQNQ